MAIFKNVEAILANAYDRIGRMGKKIIDTRDEGFDESNAQKELKIRLVKTKKILKALLSRTEFDSNGNFVRTYNIEDEVYNRMLRALIDIGKVKNLPLAPKLLYKGNPAIRVAGGPGAPGADGEDAYVYVGYATDGSGSGYASTPDASRKFIAIRSSNTPLTVTAGIFTGLWVQYIGSDGAPGAAGAAGTNGTSQYFFVGYADDNTGAGFTLTFNAAKTYIATLVKSVATPPLVGEFAGLWVRYIGTDGTNGATVLSGAGAPSAGTGSDGDFYIDLGPPKVFYGPKTGGAWGAGFDMTGTAGAAGAAGAPGAAGSDGTNAFLYIAWADDASGGGFTIAFDQNKEYIAFLQSSTVIASPVVGDFAGLWAKYRGDGDRWNTTSTTSLTIGTGTKTLVVGLNLAYSTGQRVVIAEDGNEANRMIGYCVNYNPTTGQLQVNVDEVNGAGTIAVWDVNIFSGEIGGYKGNWNYTANSDADPTWPVGSWGETDDGRGTYEDSDYVPAGSLLFVKSTGIKPL